jgi:hypothetical protein
MNFHAYYLRLATRFGEPVSKYVSLFFFDLPNPSNRTMALGLTQPLIEMSTSDLSWGKSEACA